MDGKNQRSMKEKEQEEENLSCFFNFILCFVPRQAAASEASWNSSAKEPELLQETSPHGENEDKVVAFNCTNIC